MDSSFSIRFGNYLLVITPAVKNWLVWIGSFIFSSLTNLLEYLLADCVVHWTLVASSWVNFAQVKNPDISIVMNLKIDFHIIDSLSSWIGDLPFDSQEIGDFATLGSFWQRSYKICDHALKIHRMFPAKLKSPAS